MTSIATRRELTQQYKERKTPRGIYSVRCIPTGDIWVGSSPNLDAAWNGLRFQLNATHRNAALLSAWKQYGEQAFAFEILETLNDDTAPLVLHDTLKEKRAAWAETLSASFV